LNKSFAFEFFVFPFFDAEDKHDEESKEEEEKVGIINAVVIALLKLLKKHFFPRPSWRIYVSFLSLIKWRKMTKKST